MPWTKEEDEKLTKYYEQGESVNYTAIQLGRSIGSIGIRRGALGLTKGKGNKSWTKKDEERLEKLFNDGEPDTSIAEALNRTASAISGRRTAMGLLREEINYWTEEDQEILETWIKLGKSDDEIAKKLGRSKASISSRKSAMGFSKKLRPLQTRNPIKNSGGLKIEIEPLKKGQNYLIKTTGTGTLKHQETSKEIATYKGNTDHLLIFKRENYIETYTRVDVALGEVSIREATKTDYQII